jgi:glycosyltransferase involved in cell wall biosynthesis
MSSGVVVPTLGKRPEYITQCLRSIRAAGDCEIVLVRPPESRNIDSELAVWVDKIVDDPKRGLAAAINFGISSLSSDIEFATWLGDDDRLVSGALRVASSRLLADETAVMVYGQCRYIDGENREVWLNRSGKFAAPLMLFGPQLIPQPGSLFRRRDFDAIGGLNESLKWAFDLDLFLRLQSRGKLRFIREVLAEFRWHQGSLSVGERGGSVREASQVRTVHLPRVLSTVSIVWEPLLRFVILRAGKRLSRRLDFS